MVKKSSDSLESKLEPGFHTNVAGTQIPEFPSYLNEINTFLQTKNKTIRPFVNQDAALLKLLRTLTTDYPYTVFVGEPGTGKSMILDYVTSVLTGVKPMEEVQKEFPKSVSLFERILHRSKKFEPRNYLTLANLEDPNNPICLSYTDPDAWSIDLDISESVGIEVGHYLDNYAVFNRDFIRVQQGTKEFQKYVADQASNLYSGFLKEFLETESAGLLDDVSSILFPRMKLNTIQGVKDHATYSIELLTPGIDFKDLSSLDATELGAYHSLHQLIGTNPKWKDPSFLVLEEGLNSCYLPEVFQNGINAFLKQIRTTDVTNSKGNIISEKEKEELVLAEVEKTNNAIFKAIKTAYKEDRVEEHQNLHDIIFEAVPFQSPAREISQKTKDHLLKGIHDIVDEYLPENIDKSKITPDTLWATDNCYNWIRSIPKFLEKNPKLLSRCLNEMLDEIEKVEEKKLLKLEDKKDNKDPDPNYGDITFELPHGKGNVEITEILTPGAFMNHVETSGYTLSKLEHANKDNTFGTFMDQGDDIPPHRTLQKLGKFFEGGILVFRDSFDDFIQMVSDNNEISMRERFLEYLQTGTMSLSHQGVTFSLEAPKMLVASSNDDPFSTRQDFVTKRDEQGFRNRITTIPIAAQAENTQKTRRGTLEVIQNVIKVKTENINGLLTEPLRVDPQVYDALISANLSGEHVTPLTYRTLEKQVQELIGYAIEKKQPHITLDLLKSKTKSDFPRTYFTGIERDRTSHNGWLRDKQAVGRINGLYVSDSGSGRVVVQSYVTTGRSTELPAILRTNTAFQLTDGSTKLADESSAKAHIGATDYVRLMLKEGGIKITNADWVLQSVYQGMYQGVGGPSASGALTISMLSALSEDKIHETRFMTGTIEAPSGQIGVIGGAYGKGLVPTILSKHTKKQLYFMLPTDNVQELSNALRVDPFGMEDKVVILPVENVWQAYAIATGPRTITKGFWKDIEKHAQETKYATIDRIAKNLENY